MDDLKRKIDVDVIAADFEAPSGDYTEHPVTERYIFNKKRQNFPANHLKGETVQGISYHY